LIAPEDHVDTSLVEPLDDSADAGPDPGPDPGQPRDCDQEKALLDELLDGSEARRGGSHGPVSAFASPRTRVGSLVQWSSGQPPLVDFPGNEGGPLPARTTIPLDATIITEAIASARGVLLSFEDGRPEAPIITGLLQDCGEIGTRPDTAPEVWDGDPEPERPTTIAELEARVDGRRVELEAADEIVLRCGQASIVLRSNGRVVIRGTYVETRSHGVNRVKGGSVEIN
jgi:hypothetical protein